MSRVLLLAAVCVVLTCGAFNAVGNRRDLNSIGDKLNRELHRAEISFGRRGRTFRKRHTA